MCCNQEGKKDFFFSQAYCLRCCHLWRATTINCPLPLFLPAWCCPAAAAGPLRTWGGGHFYRCWCSHRLNLPHLPVITGDTAYTNPPPPYALRKLIFGQFVLFSGVLILMMSFIVVWNELESGRLGGWRIGGSFSVSSLLCQSFDFNYVCHFSKKPFPVDSLTWTWAYLFFQGPWKWCE